MNNKTRIKKLGEENVLQLETPNKSSAFYYTKPENFVKVLQKRFSPYCSVATWYLWRSIDPEPIQY